MGKLLHSISLYALVDEEKHLFRMGREPKIMVAGSGNMCIGFVVTSKDDPFFVSTHPNKYSGKHKLTFSTFD
jgi:hypothetical protein